MNLTEQLAAGRSDVTVSFRAGLEPASDFAGSRRRVELDEHNPFHELAAGPDAENAVAVVRRTLGVGGEGRAGTIHPIGDKRRANPLADVLESAFHVRRRFVSLPRSGTSVPMQRASRWVITGKWADGWNPESGEMGDLPEQDTEDAKGAKTRNL
jgi:hypothetical protein